MNETRKQTSPGMEKAGWAKALVMALCPLLFAILACALQGKTIADVYIPASEWNDELFYYKLTENVVKFGFPQGYFGFNESHGIYLSFAAWSPVLLLPWVIWGKLLGWNLLSPVLCNLFLMMGTMFLLGRLLRPTWKQVAAIVIPFGVYSQMTRFTLSGMPEVTHWCLMLLIVGLFIGYIREEKTWKLAVSVALIVLLTWMRPYFILMFFFPFLYLIRKDKRHILTLFLVLGLTGGVYYWINHYLSAPYLTDLFYTDWIKAFGERGLGGGLLFMLHRLWDSFLFIARMAIQCVLTGYASGGLYLGFLIVGLLLLIVFFKELGNVWTFHKKRSDSCEMREGHVHSGESSKTEPANMNSANGRNDSCKWLILLLQLLLCFAGFFAAILLMYRLQEGGRHVIAFVAAGILVLAMREYDRVSYLVRAGLIILSFAFLYIVRANTPYDFQIPFRTDALQAEIEDLQAQLETEMELSADHVPNFDNTIVWVIWDYVGEEAVAVKWQQFYAVPRGFGINLCYAEYVTGQGDALNSRYVGTIPGGNVDHYLAERGKKVIAQNQDLIVYDRFEEAD